MMTLIRSELAAVTEQRHQANRNRRYTRRSRRRTAFRYTDSLANPRADSVKVWGPRLSGHQR